MKILTSYVLFRATCVASLMQSNVHVSPKMHPLSQNIFFFFFLVSYVGEWPWWPLIDVRDMLPSNIYSFTTRYMNNTLATLKSMVLWRKTTMDTCLACKEYSQSLLHVVSGCKVHLEQGRYTWRHNSILANILKSIDGLSDWRIFADIPGYPCPTVVIGTRKRTDVILVHQENAVTVLELTCGFVNNVKGNGARKVERYKSTIVDLKKKYEKVMCVNMSMNMNAL